MPRGALNGERDVCDAYAAHSGELYGIAVRVLGKTPLAEEAVKEAFLRAWRDRDRFDPGVGTLRAWLFAILRDAVIELGRVEHSVEALEQSFLAWQIEEAMRRIGEPYRQALVETYYRGRSCAEVATELGLPEATVKSRLNDGLRALRQALEELSF
jgi:RNA polymerase sigma-70 factor (ECF subfamily)